MGLVAQVQDAPRAYRAIPLGWDLGENIDPRPYIFASLTVVSGRRQQRVRPPCQLHQVAGVENGQRETELLRVAAHLIQRCQREMPVKRGVLQPLSHNRSAELL